MDSIDLRVNGVSIMPSTWRSSSNSSSCGGGVGVGTDDVVVGFGVWHLMVVV